MSLEAYIRQHIGNLRQEIIEKSRETIREWMANLITSTTIARASEDDNDPLVDDVQLWASSDGFSTSNAEGGETARPRARRMEQAGFACVPLEKEPSKVFGIGANLLHFAVASTRYRPKGLKQGEWAIYNLREVATQLVIRGNKDSEVTISVGPFVHLRVDKDGQVTIDAKGAKDVVVNGGTLKVARVTDNCTITPLPGGPLALWMSQVEQVCNGVVPGFVNPLSAALVANPGVTIRNQAADGAQRFKG